MGKRKLTDLQVRQILADRATGMTTEAIAEKYGLARSTVIRHLSMRKDEYASMLARKKEEDDIELREYMLSRRQRILDIVDIALEVLPEKIRAARTASDVTTAAGTILDKYRTVMSDSSKREVGEGGGLIVLPSVSDDVSDTGT